MLGIKAQPMISQGSAYAQGQSSGMIGIRAQPVIRPWLSTHPGLGSVFN